MRLIILLVFISYTVIGQNTDQNPFRQMYDLLPTANSYRTATGAPGHEYWQNRADYKLTAKLNESTNER